MDEPKTVKEITETLVREQAAVDKLNGEIESLNWRAALHKTRIGYLIRKLSEL